MPLATPVLKAQLAIAFVNAMKAYRNFDQSGNAGVDQFTAATNAAGKVFGDDASAAVDAFVKSGTVQTAVVTAGSAVAQVGTGLGAVT
jgi:hypothetical protein